MPSPTVFAHRGFAGVAPENTVAAARAAAETADAIEVDVRPAADGTPVVFHDERLEGDRRRDGIPLTDREGLVRETPLETVRAATVLGSGKPVPTLAELLEAVPAGTGANVELKNPGVPATDLRPGESLPERDRIDRRRAWQPFVDRVVDVCDDADVAVRFSSFCEGALAAAREVAPEYEAAPLLRADLEAGLDVARRYDCEAIHPPRNAVLGTALASESYAGLAGGEPAVDVLEVAREEGRTVAAWTVETWTQFAELADAGVDGIIAEYPGLGGSFGEPPVGSRTP